jgi:ferredoxin
MARLSLLIDVTKCSGCHNCFLACRDEYYDNDYPGYSAPQPLDGQFWMQIKEVERGSYPKVKVDYIPLPCQHCEKATCIDAAADGAVYRRKDGIVLIDPKKAKSQKAIVNSCPCPRNALCVPIIWTPAQANRAAWRPARPEPSYSATWTIPRARSPRLRLRSKARPTILSTAWSRWSPTWVCPNGSSPARSCAETSPASVPKRCR